MAYEIPIGMIGSLRAGANYSSATNQFRVVDSTAADIFLQQNTAGSPCLGVLQDLPGTSEAGTIMFYGVSKVRVNTTSHAAIAVGDKLCASSGGGVRASTAVARYVIGRALEAQTANTTGIITMMITHQGSGSTGAAGGA